MKLAVFRRTRQPTVLAVVAIAAVGACSGPAGDTHDDPPVSQPAVEFIGTERCAGCHEPEFRAWRESHHANAIAVASAGTVRGDFDRVEIVNGDETLRFVTPAPGEFAVEVSGGVHDGRVLDVTHTFGIDPLQQYLVEFGGGRLQALTVAWDSRAEAEGGQRWYRLNPAGDQRLHWSGIYQNWNFMCAECHSTALTKNYDARARTFETGWQELSVGCEACHGPGSAHVQAIEDGTAAASNIVCAGRAAHRNKRLCAVPLAPDDASRRVHGAA